MARTLFSGGRVFDARSGVTAQADLVTDGDRIVDVGPGLDGDEQVDVSGATLLPGLFDCHVHLVFTHFDTLRLLAEPFSLAFFRTVRNLETTLRLGITTVRDASGADMGVREAVAQGIVAGPRVRIAVTMLSQTGGHGDGWSPSGYEAPFLAPHPGVPSGLCDGVDEARRVVREVVRAGADQIKIAVSGGVLSPLSDPRRAQLAPDELDVIVAEATAAGLSVMAHAHGAEGIKNGVRAGVRSVEHGTMLDDEAIGLMVERGTWLVPTLSATRGAVEAAERGVLTPRVAEKAHLAAAGHLDSFRRAVAAGVKVAMGTDAPVRAHGTNLDELGMMVDGGLTPAQAWQATTVQAAELMDLTDELGTLEAGKRADVVVLDGDTGDVTNLAQRVRSVWKDGREVF